MAKLERTYDTISYLKYFPEHWEVTRIKNVFEEIDERSEDGTEELLSVSHYTGVTLKRDSLENEDDFLTNAKTLEGYKKVTKGDLVSNIMLAWNGSMGISPYDGITSPAYCVYRIKNGYNPDYFGYLFGTNLMKTEFRKKSTGIIDSRLRLYSDKFFSIFTVIPPLEEQNKIVAFIEAKTIVINHFISQKQKFIALLKEQRQSTINERLSEKGKKVKIKFCVTKVGAGVTPTGGATVYQESGVLFLRSQNVHNDGLRLNDVAYISKEINSEMKGSQVKYEDVLINITGASIGRCFVFDKREDANVNQHVCILRPKKDTILSEYLMLQLQSNRIQTLINMIEGASREGLTNNELKNYFIFVPSLKEQEKIIQHIKSETQKIDHTISQTEKEIELIKEYKEAMIAEAVMGKVNIKKAKVPQSITTKKEANWEFKEAVLISVLTDKFGSEQYPLGRKRYTKYSYLFHRHTDNKTEGYLKKAAGPYNPKTKYGGPEKIALQNKYVSEVQNGNLSGFVASDKIEDARNYFGNYWNTESLNWLEQLRYKKNDELELYATVDKAMVELAESNRDINLQLVKQIIDEHPEWKPKLERDIFSDDNIAKAMEFLKQLFQ
ncbi:restriction endonuclease subunit S [Elizabethkingia anophelis]|nr:restriction endonuclease subunit S [Elizabethkingia anophelis]